MGETGPGGVWPLPVQNKIESTEGKHEHIVEKINEFFDAKGYTDTKGNPVKLEDVHWPTPEEETAHKDIVAFIESDDLKPYFLKDKSHDEDDYKMLKSMLREAADYLDEAVTFDSMKTKEDHHDVRRVIEKEFKTAAEEKPEKYNRAYHTYYENRLSLKHIRNTYQIMDVFFKKQDFTQELQELHDKGMMLQEDVVSESDREFNEANKDAKGGLSSKRYQLLDDAGKFEATQETAQYVIKFFDNLKKLSHENKVVA